LYEPRGDEAPERGVFVVVHGGGFVKGAKASGRPYGLRMARRGYVAVSIDYRLSQGQGPQRVLAAVSDARQAIGWLQDNAAAYRLDAGHIAVGGSSAGAITALHLAYTDAAVDPGVEPARVAAVMDLWGGLYGRIEELGAGEAPLVIVHGTEDSTVPYSEAVALRDRAEQVGVPYAFHPIEGAGHAPFDPDQHVAWTARFFYDQVWAHGGGATKILVPVALARWPIGPASGK
ncbi:MAG: alpha/beta hydrolase, partial [Anaerolineae bacterium]